MGKIKDKGYKVEWVVNVLEEKVMYGMKTG